MDRDAALRSEYAEAGSYCRAQESYVRTTLNIYVVLATSAGALLASVPMSTGARAAMCAAVFAVGLCMFLLVVRHRQLYAASAARARTIESELGMSLYTDIKKKFPASAGATAKTLSAFVVGAVAGLYLVAAVVIALRG